VKLHDPSTEAVATFEELLSHGTTTPWAVDVAAPDVESAAELADRLAALPTVGEARTVLDYVPKDQDEKLESIETASYLVPETIIAGRVPSDAERRTALRELQAEAARTAETASP